MQGPSKGQPFLEAHIVKNAPEGGDNGEQTNVGSPDTGELDTKARSVRFHGETAKEGIREGHDITDKHTGGLSKNFSAADDASSFSGSQRSQHSEPSTTTGRSTIGSDNVSTRPVKSLSPISTKAPSVLSIQPDSSSFVPSTAETSIAPSVHTTNQNLTPAIINLQQHTTYDRDSESIVTLASSTRRFNRRSLDTNSSVAGIPPASILERLSTQNAANSIYAPSIQNSNYTERTSMYNAQTAASRSSTELNDQVSST